ncbi:MAG TPA: putative lipid II flippase FtsW [Candidatus Limnocylindrales bacterium]|nr:putative lipid II flippase FtsW [Candidatus Limnocylindrales bacterium]
MPRSVQPDRKLFGVTLALCCIGVVMVFSASAVTAKELYGNGYVFLERQMIWLAVGLFGMIRLMNFDYRKLREPRVIYPGLAVILVMLIGVLFLDRTHATHRWIHLGPASLQPSEFAKLVVILYLAWFLELRLQPGGFGVNNLQRTLLPALGPVLLILALILREPDMGTACMIFLVALVLLFEAGMSMKYVGGAAVASLPAVYLLIIHAHYRYERILAFFSPGADPQGRGFQLLQSLIAVGSGGLTGVGLMESKQKLFYLPEAHTDFIYAVLCEELGYIGAVAVLVLFGMYAWRGFRAAYRAPDEFGRLLALGITVLVVGQALVNLSVVVGLMPTKGIPLPFISYGGSSLVVMLWATGVLLNISQHAEPL